MKVEGEPAVITVGFKLQGIREDKQWVRYNFYKLILDKDIQLGISGNKYG